MSDNITTSPMNVDQLVLSSNPYNQTFSGFYRGVVLQNNDPDRRGRVKIFISSFAPHLYNQWFDANTDGQFTDKKFRFPNGDNLYKDGNNDLPGLKQIFEKVKEILPWAEQASGIVGSGSSGLFSFGDQQATISDAADESRFSPYKDSRKAAGGDLNIDNTGEAPGYKFEPDDDSTDLHDGFVSLNQDKMPEVNPFAKIYKPSTYSNITKGMFSIPCVGASVWVFFEGGSILKPVYFAYSFDKHDWQSVYDIVTTDPESNGPHYPGAFENTSIADKNIYRKNKTVFNFKAGALEFTDTDDHEQVKLTQASGSFMQFSNKATIHYASAAEQKLVAGHQFETVNLSKNIHVRKNLNIGADESIYTRIGLWNFDAYEGWKDQNRIVADTRARFAIKRATLAPAPSDISLPAGSVLQERSGQFASNPILKESTPVVISPAITQVYERGPVASAQTGNQASSLVTAVEAVKTSFSVKSVLALSPEQAGGLLSTSTQDGTWDPDDNYLDISNLETAQAARMLEFETKFGTGGDQITEITRHKVDIIGCITNDTPAVRVDTIGRMSFNEVQISPGGAFASQKPSPLVERVANDGKFPCGNYTLVIGNSFNVTTGSGGIKLMSAGCVDIAGTQVIIAGSNEVIMSSSGDVKIASGSRFNVEADIITFTQSQGKQVGIESSLGVKNNLLVAGSTYVEGELFVNHITAPVEIQETEEITLYGTTVTNKVIGHFQWMDGWVAVYGGNTPGGNADADCIVNVPHSHNFKNIPLNLKANNIGVRQDALALNVGSIQVGALPVRNGMKKLT